MLCTPLVQWNESNSKWCWCCHHLTNIKMMYCTSITEMTHRMVICITFSLPLRVEGTNRLANITDTSTIRNLIWLDVGWKRSSPFMEEVLTSQNYFHRWFGPPFFSSPTLFSQSQKQQRHPSKNSIPWPVTLSKAGSILEGFWLWLLSPPTFAVVDDKLCYIFQVFIPLCKMI